MLGLDLYGGTLGVAVFLAALANTTGERRWAALAEQCTRNQLDQLRAPEMRAAVESTPLGIGTGVVDATSRPSFPAGHLCRGRCGRIELLLEAGNRLADNTLRDAAISQAMMVKSQANESGFYTLNGADRGRLFAPSFFQGVSGIGYTFLRVVNPQLPSILSFA